jgi:hypothetical protein
LASYHHRSAGRRGPAANRASQGTEFHWPGGAGRGAYNEDLSRNLIWLLIAIPYGVLYLIHGLAPEIQPDGYTYHLGLVAEWLRVGGIPDRVGFYEALPQVAEFLFLPAFAAGGAPAAKLAHLVSLGGAVWLILGIARRLSVPGAAAAVLFACAPVVGIDASSAYNDVMLAFFALAALAALIAGRNFLAGAMAGLCYGVKMTGGVFALAGLACLMRRKEWKRAAIYCAGVALLAAPWLIRNAIWIGNPVAPLYNDWFPNPYFHPSTEAALLDLLRNYRLAPVALPLEVTVRGEGTAGMIGPVFLLAPLALLALRKREARPVLLFVAFGLAPWLLNAGTRFLIPALPFLALALAAAMPARAMTAIAALHALISFPPMLDAYAPNGAWRLKGFPWQAALRIQPHEEYLREKLPEYAYAELLNAQVKPGARVLDLASAPTLYTHATLIRPWQHAAGDRAAEALRMASALSRGELYEMHARIDGQPRTAIRLVLEGGSAEAWSIQEISLYRGGARIVPQPFWRAAADDFPSEARFAFDGNPATRWCGWRPARAGNSYLLNLRRAERVDEIRVLFYKPWRGMRVRIDGHKPDPSFRPVAPLNWRREAVRGLRAEGFEFVLIPDHAKDWGRIGADMLARAEDWGVTPLGHAGYVYLFGLGRP